MDWIYGQIVGFLGNFFALMGNMGVELFELEWVSAIVLFFSRLAWALFTVSVVVCAFECGIEYSTGRGNLQQCGMNIIKGFLAVSLFTVVPVRLYALSVSLQGTFSAGLTGYGRSIGEVGQDIITELSEIQTLSDVINSSHFGLGILAGFTTLQEVTLHYFLLYISSTLRSAPKTPSSVPCGRFCRLQRHPDTRYPRQRAWVFCAAQPAAANRCHPYWKQLCVCRQGLTRPRPYPAKRKPTISISAMKALTRTVCPVH